jgi:nucleotide-binding universal stress UspA family protein
MNDRAVLVGVDGSPPSLAAVDLALREARLRGRSIRVVYADVWARHPAFVDSGSVVVNMLTDPEAALRAARERISAAGAGDTPVATEVLGGDPAAVLIRESAGAELVVLGHRGHGGFPELLLGSVAAKVAGHAACPVLVTRGEPPVTGEVVLGVADTGGPGRVVGFAFEEAALRGVGLVAVHAWRGPHPSGPSDPLIYQPASDRREQERQLDLALAGWRDRYPGVPVRTELAWGKPARVLVEAGTGAQLMVLGARGTGGMPGRRLGAVTHALLHHASCPVAVVHAAQTSAP